MAPKHYPELYILRHGETFWNVEGRMQGALNSPLTPTGIAQAKRQGKILQDIDLNGFDVLTSPQGRAFETAAIALSRSVACLRTEERLREIGVGDWAGYRRADLQAQVQAAQDLQSDLEYYEYAPGGEGFAALEARCTALLDSLQGPAVLVTHGITSRMLRATVLGLGLAGLAELAGGQGCVYHLCDGVQKRLI